VGKNLHPTPLKYPIKPRGESRKKEKEKKKKGKGKSPFSPFLLMTGKGKKKV